MIPPQLNNDLQAIARISLITYRAPVFSQFENFFVLSWYSSNQDRADVKLCFHDDIGSESRPTIIIDCSPGMDLSIDSSRIYELAGVAALHGMRFYEQSSTNQEG